MKLCPTDRDWEPSLAESVCASPDDVSKLVFAYIVHYKETGKEGVDFIVNCLERDNPFSRRDVLKFFFLALDAGLPGYSPLPRQQERRLLDAVGAIFRQDTKGDFVGKFCELGGGLHSVAMQMGSYLAARFRQGEEKIEPETLQLFETILDLSLERMKTHGYEKPDDNIFPFQRFNRILTETKSPELLKIYVDRADHIKTAADCFEADLLREKGKEAYEASCERKTLQATRDQLEMLLRSPSQDTSYADVEVTCTRVSGPYSSGVQMKKQF